jgi:hypothetical protein
MPSPSLGTQPADVPYAITGDRANIWKLYFFTTISTSRNLITKKSFLNFVKLAHRGILLLQEKERG